MNKKKIKKENKYKSIMIHEIFCWAIKYDLYCPGKKRSYIATNNIFSVGLGTIHNNIFDVLKYSFLKFME